MIHHPRRRCPPKSGAAILLTIVFIEFQICRLVGNDFELHGGTVHIRPDQIAGYQEQKNYGGLKCLKLLMRSGHQLFVHADYKTVNLINRGSRPR